MAKANSVIDTILGEAVSGTRAQRYGDMLGIASVIANRAAATNTTPEQVVSAPGQFSAYGKTLPKGADAYRGLAEEALQEVEINGPIHNATFYATPSATKNLPPGLQRIDQTAGHVYYSDPLNRAIRTATGYIKPAATTIAGIPGAAVKTLNTITAPVQNTAAALRTAAFDPVSSIPSVPAARPSAPTRGLGLEALAPGGLIGSGPLAAYSRAGLTPGVVGVLDALASNPAAATVSVNSGYRSPTRNAAVGGAKHSQHISGNAVDLNVRGLTDQQKASLLDTAIESGAKGIGLYSSGNVIHMDARAKPAVWSNSYAGIPVSAAPSWARPALQDMMDAGPFAVTPRTAPPVPTARPHVPTAFAAPPSLASMSQPSSAYATTNLPTPRSAPSVPASNAYATTNLPSPRPSAPAIPPSNAYATTNLPAVAPTAPSVPSALTSPSLMGLPQTFSPQTPVQPTFTAMAQPVAPPVAAPVAPVAPPVSVPRQATSNAFPSAPQRPSMPSAMDVYNGQANLGRANDGSMVSRDQFGNVSITNKYGATTTTLPSGQMAVSYGRAPSPATSFPSAPSIDGPLGAGGITTKQGGLFGIQPAQTETGNLARGFTGAMAGSALGSFAGPIGSIIGAAIGKSIAQGKNPFDALSRNNGFTTYNTPAFGAIRAAAPVAGGAFPTAPTVRGALGGTQSNRSDSGMRSISPGAASAISRGVGGLY